MVYHKTSLKKTLKHYRRNIWFLFFVNSGMHCPHQPLHRHGKRLWSVIVTIASATTQISITLEVIEQAD